MSDPYPTLDDAIRRVEEINKYFLDRGNPDNVDTTRYHTDNGPAVISSALIGVHEKSLPPGIQDYHKKCPAWVGIAPETEVAHAGNLNIKLRDAVYNNPGKVQEFAGELITSLEELKNTPS